MEAAWGFSTTHGWPFGCPRRTWSERGASTRTSSDSNRSTSAPAGFCIAAAAQVDLPGLKTVDGVAEIQGNYPSKGATGELGAWFRDSEGNMLGLGQPVGR